jgi:hypothetical protein
MTSRREFLKAAGVAPALLLAAQYSSKGLAAAAEESKLPQIAFGKHRISRLICGANPFNGGSHLSGFVDRAMKEYYTSDQILRTLRRCEEAGINCWQSGLGPNCDLYRRYVDQGGKMNFLAIESNPKHIAPLAEAGTIGVAHHGELTDHLFKTGQIDKIADFLKRVKDAGLMAGVSTHMPAVVDTIESKGWDLDYYMTCVYQRHRSKEELEKLLGQAPLPIGEVYLSQDPPRMYKAVQHTKRICLAFKILAAGRLSDRREWVEQAFKQAFESIKPGDGVIVGIYDRYADQPGEDAAFTRRFVGPRTAAS